ncbi:MAG TPA: hypothetical protein VMQ51_08405 [Candidatus Binatia bacterium]|nr:hypothetical protein [Candidatus Binatia bacterium]
MTPGVVRLAARADALLSRFSVAWVEDKAVERRARRCTWAAVACALLTVVSMGAFGALVIAVPAAVLLMVLAVLAFRYHRLDIEDRKLQAVMRVLTVLRADVPREQRVALTVDLRRYGAGERVKNGRVTRYQHRWLELVTTLADGNTITLEASDRVKEKRKRKRTRTLASSDVRIAVRFAKRYRPIGPIADALRGHAPGTGRPGPFTPGAEDRGPQAERQLQASYRTRPAEGTAAGAGPHGWDGLATGDTLLSAVRHVYAGIARARRAG